MWLYKYNFVKECYLEKTRKYNRFAVIYFWITQPVFRRFLDLLALTSISTLLHPLTASPCHYVKTFPYTKFWKR